MHRARAAGAAPAAAAAEEESLSRVHVPFGPFLALGAILCLFWGDAVWRAVTVSMEG